MRNTMNAGALNIIYFYSVYYFTYMKQITAENCSFLIGGDQTNLVAR